MVAVIEENKAAVKERPILFSGPMVRAILEGRKTQTRRVFKFPKHMEKEGSDWVKAIHEDGGGNWVPWSTDAPGYAEFTKQAYPKGEGLVCPYGRPGDRLWVRETWRERGSVQRVDGKVGVGTNFYNNLLFRADGNEWDGPWRPSIFMPRKASRITLEITSVRAERLREITRDDIVREGVGEDWWPSSNLCAQWEKGWDAINGKRPGCAWRDNPWVWVVGFKPLKIRKA